MENHCAECRYFVPVYSDKLGLWGNCLYIYPNEVRAVYKACETFKKAIPEYIKDWEKKLKP